MAERAVPALPPTPKVQFAVQAHGRAALIRDELVREGLSADPTGRC